MGNMGGWLLSEVLQDVGNQLYNCIVGRRSLKKKKRLIGAYNKQWNTDTQRRNKDRRITIKSIKVLNMIKPENKTSGGKGG